ncbi:MAG: hypothetical protein R3240_06745, partial [Gammaproteobacteria bacterium]|nr:hypothetical protein [Gammaproteobacteria bacterium]
MNTLGASIGSFLYILFSKQNALGLAINSWRYSLFEKGRYFDLGLIVIAIWCLAKLTTFLPALSFAAISADISNINDSISSTQQFLSACGFATEILTILCIVSLCLKKGHNVLIITIAFCAFILTLRIPIYGINIS